MSNEKIYVGIIGYGTVGKGTVQVLIDNFNTIYDKTGIEIIIKSVADLKFDNDEYLEKIAVKTNDVYELINDEEISIIVELIGGYKPAKKFILDALNAGKHVVTANKALLAMYGKELFKAAEENGVNLGFEGSVGGGIPIVRVMKEDLVANNITEIYGIINGTANYILTEMEKTGKDFAAVLKEAQDLGYAEADPSFDVNGDDTAHKITVLASIAFKTLVPYEKVFVEGISEIKPIDIEYARKLGCKIKLLAIAKKFEDDIEVRVHPTIIPDRYILSKVEDVFNAIYLVSDKVDRTIHYGRGAGSLPTGSAVAGDIISIARDLASGCKKRVPVLGFKSDYTSYYPIRDINDIKSSFYLRFTALDEPGVMSEIAGILGKYDVSIASAIQSGEGNNGNIVPLVFMTHKILGRNLFDAVKEIDLLDIVRDKTVVLRVEGRN